MKTAAVEIQGDVMGKRCTVCGEWGPRASFTPRRVGRLLCSAQCKLCRNRALRAKSAARPKEPRTHKSIEARFWSRIIRDPSGCWLWGGHRNDHGYGKTTIRDGAICRQVYTHRLAFALHHGRDERTLGTLDHKVCQNPPCCNPLHLEEVTPAENSRRGRRAKITKRDAVEIRRRYALGESAGALGAAFGLSRLYVLAIIYRKRWTADMADVEPSLGADEAPGEGHHLAAVRNLTGRVHVQRVVCAQLNRTLSHCHDCSGACGGGEGGASHRALPSRLAADAHRSHGACAAVAESEGGNSVAAPRDIEDEGRRRVLARNCPEGGALPLAVEGRINGATTTQDETDDSETSAHATPPGPMVPRAGGVFHGAGVGA